MTKPVHGIKNCAMRRTDKFLLSSIIVNRYPFVCTGLLTGDEITILEADKQTPLPIRRIIEVMRSIDLLITIANHRTRMRRRGLCRCWWRLCWLCSRRWLCRFCWRRPGRRRPGRRWRILGTSGRARSRGLPLCDGWARGRDIGNLRLGKLHALRKMGKANAAYRKHTGYSPTCSNKRH